MKYIDANGNPTSQYFKDVQARKKEFIDKEHAVGLVLCLEDHFSRINTRLNDAGFPHDGAPFHTIENRVATALSELADTHEKHRKAVEACDRWQANFDKMHDEKMKLEQQVKKLEESAHPQPESAAPVRRCKCCRLHCRNKSTCECGPLPKERAEDNALHI